MQSFYSNEVVLYILYSQQFEINAGNISNALSIVMSGKGKARRRVLGRENEMENRKYKVKGTEGRGERECGGRVREWSREMRNC